MAVPSASASAEDGRDCETCQNNRLVLVLPPFCPSSPTAPPPSRRPDTRPPPPPPPCSLQIPPMGQSPSRRPVPAPAAPASTTASQHAAPAPRRSLPRRILSSIRKPSLRSRSLAPAPPRQPEQPLRGRKRLWTLTRRRSVQASTEGAVPERMDPLPEHDEHHVDRDVDELGVITLRVPDSHTDSDSPAVSPKGRERASRPPTADNDIEQGDPSPTPSSSTVPPVAHVADRIDHVEEAVAAPTIPSRQPSPPLVHEPAGPFTPLPQTPTFPPPPQPLSQQANTIPRPFPPPGTLVVVQGVVHTTDAARSADRPVAVSNPTPPSTNNVLNLNNDTGSEFSSTRPSSVPPGSRSRNPLSGILARPTSMLPSVPSSRSTEPISAPSSNDSQQRQSTPIASSTMEENEDEEPPRAHPHGISMAQGPVGASGLSASSIDVLGTLLSVAAAATAASLLTGSSEPIFSTGLAPSQPPLSSNSVSQPPSFSPSERPLSPTPTSDAGRMRHVWSSLRDRLGLGSGGQDVNQPNDATPGSGPGQGLPSQPTDILRPRDPREIMLAEMARAFNLGLGLGGATPGTPTVAPSANSNISELVNSDDSGVLPREREHQVLPPPDSFERFLIDLQSDLRVTLMQDQEPGVSGELPRNADETAEDVDDDEPIPELQSLTDSDSEDFETRHFGSDDEADPDYDEDTADNSDEDLRTAPEELSGRTSPAVSALGSGVHSPFGVGTRPASISSQLHAMPSQSSPAAIFSAADVEIAVNGSTAAEDNNAYVDAVYAASGMGSHAPARSLRHLGVGEDSGGQREGAVLGVAYSLEASNEGRRVEAEGVHTAGGPIAVPPLDVQDPSNVPAAATGRESFLPRTSLFPGSLTPPPPTLLPGTAASTALSQSPTLSLPTSLDPEPPSQTFTNSSMPFRLPFTPSSASRTEHTPGGGINWWRMYRFPAIASPNSGQGSQGPLPVSQTASPLMQDPSHAATSPWIRRTDQNQQNEVLTPRGVARSSGLHNGLASAAASTNTPQLASISNEGVNVPTNGQESYPPTHTNNSLPEQRSNVVVPVIVVGLQSVNMDRQPPDVAHPPGNHSPGMDDEDGEVMDYDGLEQPMSMPLHIPEPPEFRRHSGPPNTNLQEQNAQQPARGRTWQSRAASAIRNLRPSRRNADATSPPPQEAPGSRTFLIYVIGGYYPPDHQIITGGNLDSFEALWDLAEMLGQVKPPTVSKEEIEKSGLEIIRASSLEEYEKQGRVASNCIERCLICLDDYYPEDELRVLSCKHTFHQGCVDRWLETGRNNCPACRTKGVGNENASPTPAASPEPATA